MKDLYKHLGLTPDANAEAIERALHWHTGSSVAEAVREVLLSRHRHEYDLAHRQLRCIAQLRANLGLTDTELWRQSEAGDFDVAPPQPHSQLAKLKHGKAIKSRLYEPLPEWVRYGLLTAIVLPWLWWCGKPMDPVGDVSPLGTVSVASDPSVIDEPLIVEPITDLSTPAVPTIIEASPQAMPATGIISRRAPYNRRGPLLRIRTGAATGNVLAKVVDANSDIEAVRVFVRRGTSASVPLPPGEYKVRYAAGDTWYGPETLFGSETSYAVTDEALALTLTETEAGVQYTIGTIELVDQVGGNLETTQISPSEF